MPTPRPAPGLTVLLAALAAIGPFTIDAYLPAFPEIAADLGVDQAALQQTLSIYLFAFGLMTLWHGALSDSFGRRRVILIGVAVYGLAAFGCALAPDIETLWLMRALQGLSAGAGMVVSRALVRDLYQGPAAQRLISHIAIMFAAAPAVAPMLGGLLLGLVGWRAIFVFLGGAAGVLCLACWRHLPESLPPEKRQPLAPLNLLRGYLRVGRDGPFFAASAGIGLFFGGFFIYVLSAPIYIREHLGLGAGDFHWLFVPAMLGMMSGSWLSARTAGRWTTRRTLHTAFALMGLAAVVNVLVSSILPPLRLTSLLAIPLYTLGMALAMPSVTLSALDRFPERRGLAASCQSFLQTLVSSGIAAFVAPALWHSRLGLALGMSGLGGSGALLVWAHFRFTRRRPDRLGRPGRDQ